MVRSVACSCESSPWLSRSGSERGTQRGERRQLAHLRPPGQSASRRRRARRHSVQGAEWLQGRTCQSRRSIAPFADRELNYWKMLWVQRCLTFNYYQAFWNVLSLPGPRGGPWPGSSTIQRANVLMLFTLKWVVRPLLELSVSFSCSTALHILLAISRPCALANFSMTKELLGQTLSIRLSFVAASASCEASSASAKTDTNIGTPAFKHLGGAPSHTGVICVMACAW